MQTHRIHPTPTGEKYKIIKETTTILLGKNCHLNRSTVFRATIPMPNRKV